MKLTEVNRNAIVLCNMFFILKAEPKVHVVVTTLFFLAGQGNHSYEYFEVSRSPLPGY